MRGVSKRKANPLIDSRAVRIAREALDEVGEGGVGKHIGVAGMGRNVATHRFEAEMPGYPGWEWQAVLACAEGSRYVTVNEVALVPGGEALQPPEWVPYEPWMIPAWTGKPCLNPAWKTPRSAGAPSSARIRIWRPRRACNAAPVRFM